MDIHFFDTDDKVRIIGATIIVQCKTCGSKFGFRLLEGTYAPANFDYCITCAKVRDAQREGEIK